RLEPAPAQRTGAVVLRHDAGTLLFLGQRRRLLGRLAGTARTLGAQPSARVVSARRPQVRQPARGPALGSERHDLLRSAAALAGPRLAPGAVTSGPGRLHFG